MAFFVNYEKKMANANNDQNISTMTPNLFELFNTTKLDWECWVRTKINSYEYRNFLKLITTEKREAFFPENIEQTLNRIAPAWIYQMFFVAPEALNEGHLIALAHSGYDLFGRSN